MPNEVVDVVGLAMWAKVLENDHDMGSVKGENGAMWDYPEASNLNLILDQEELMKVTRACPGVKPKVTDEGLQVKFNRAWVNMTNPAWGGAPVIKDADGNPWDQTKRIGNMSKVRVAAETYDTKFGKFMRLMAIQVLEFVEPEMPDAPDIPF